MPQASIAVTASFPSERTTLAAGAAIFHLASARVVLCWHTRDRYWFLPKGRLNANETIISAAEREGFEESGYRNRVLPLPIQHRQPDPEDGPKQVFVTEPLWTQLLPLSSRSQYILFWYAAETLPPEIETSYAVDARALYASPPPFPTSMTLAQRVALDSIKADDGTQAVYEPVHHENTGVDEEEACYVSYLLPIADARHRVKGSVMEDVIRRAWEAVQLRFRMEEDLHTSPT